MRSTTSCTPSGCARGGSSTQTSLLDDRLGGRLHTRHFNLFAEEHVRHLGGNVVLPMITLVNGLIQSFPLFLTFKATDPDIEIVFFLPHKAPENDHAFRDLERNDLLFHELDPFFTLPRLRTILP